MTVVSGKSHNSFHCTSTSRSLDRFHTDQLYIENNTLFKLCSINVTFRLLVATHCWESTVNNCFIPNFSSINIHSEVKLLETFSLMPFLDSVMSSTVSIMSSDVVFECRAVYKLQTLYQKHQGKTRSNKVI